MRNVVVVTGIPGVGSSTVLKKVMETDGSEEYVLVNYGDVMLSVAMDEGYVKHRDEMRVLPPDIQKKIQNIAAVRISQIEAKVTFVDTHCTIKTPKGYLPGLPKWVLDELEPKMFVLVEADPEEIYQRRLKDKSRIRDMESIDAIRIHQEVNRAIAMSYAFYTGATVKIIKNHDNGLEKAVEQFLKLLE